MKTILYLARHGETIWNKAHRFQGQLDSPLTRDGEQQSRQIAELLFDKSIDMIISSSLGRAVKSAVICQSVLKVPHYIESKLNERHLGQWQGQQINVLKGKDIYHQTFHQFTSIAPEGGESAMTCAERVHKALIELCEENKMSQLLVITHGEALRCLLAKLGYQSANNAYEMFNNASILQLDYQLDSQKFLMIKSPQQSTYN